MADDDAITIEPVSPPPAGANGHAAAPPETWRVNKSGGEYIPRGPGKPGTINRKGDETIEEARARDAAASEKRPRRQGKVPKPKMPEASRRLDSRELEASLTMALKAPGALALTMAKDDWLHEHFMNHAPILSRQIILASEHNPWLRRRIEEAATGQDAMWAVISLVGMGTAVFSYAAPPVIYLFNLPVPQSARDRWGMPSKPRPPYAASPETPSPAEASEPDASPLAA